MTTPHYFKDIRLRMPALFSFNILRNVYKEFGLRHYSRVKSVMSSECEENFEMFPIINPWKTSIEQRAKYISKHLPELLEKKKAQKAHILAYSISGLDYRYYISQMEGAKYISTLTTISCPHM